MYKVLTLNKISKAGLSNLAEDKYEICETLSSCENPDGVLLRSFNMHEMELPKSLLAVGRAGAGVNNIPIEKCSEKGIVVFNTPGANANAVKELVVCALLLSSRKVVDGINWSQSLNGQQGVAKLVEGGKSSFVGPEIADKKLGVVGLGAIGILVANAAMALGMEVYGYDPFLPKNETHKFNRCESLDEVYANSDYITLHVPSTANTKNMVNADTIAKMKKGVRIINLSRGDLVDNGAIKAALEAETVSCYVTDFPTEDLLCVKNIITIPHLGASTPESEENCAKMAAKQLREYLEFGSIKNSVNFPNCELGEIKGNRICVLYKNTEGIENALSKIVSEKSQFSNVKGDYGYVVFDVANASENMASEIEKVDGVILVRII